MKKKAERPHEKNDISFLPPYSEQARYLFLADKYLSLDGSRNVVHIDSSRHFKRYRKKTRAA